MPATDPHHRFRRQLALQVAACWAVALLAGLWAWQAPVPPAPTLPAAAATAGGPAATAMAIDAAAWNVQLWRPFTDEAPSAAPSAPLALKLLSILQQGDGLTAAIDPGNNAGLAYVKAGDSCNGFTVVRVESDGVVVRIDGRERRLELGR